MQAQTQTQMAKVLRDLADLTEAGRVEIDNIMVQNDLHDLGVDRSGFRIREDSGLRDMTVAYRVIKRTPPSFVTVNVGQMVTGDTVTAAHFNRVLGDSITNRTLTIDTSEYPMLDSDPSLQDYIKRILIELGFKGEYTSHKMVTRPGKAPLLELEGVA